MRVAVPLALALALAFALTGTAREPTKSELLAAVERQLRAASAAAGPSVALLVVARSDRYPKPPAAAAPGVLGGYDRAEFLRLNPNDAKLAVTLDLADPKNATAHDTACGVVVHADGLVLVPFHAIEGATRVYAHLPGRGGSYADVHAADARADLAVLKLHKPPPDLKPIRFAEVTLTGRGATVGPGKLVIACGGVPVPGAALDHPRVALGGIGAVRRPRPEPTARSETYYQYGPLLEHDARAPGLPSGAALLNLDGELVGLCTAAGALAGADRGPQVAFPADDNFRRIVEVLKRGEEVEYGYLGVVLETGAFGVTVRDLVRDGPADRAGVYVGDGITAVDGAPVTDYSDLLYHVGSALAGSKVRLTVSGSGRARNLTVTLGKFKHDQFTLASNRPDPVFGLRVDYNSVLAQAPVGPGPRNLTPPLLPGVVVREVLPDSPAAAAFKKLGDEPKRWLVTRVGETPVTTPAEFYRAAKGQRAVTLTVIDPNEVNAREREVPLP